MLTFNLKKRWYEKIKSGEKTIEYREVKDYWTRRIKKLFPDVPDWFDDVCVGDWIHCSLAQVECVLRLGYTQKYMLAKINKIAVVDGKDTDLAIDKKVYAIHLANVREVTE